MPTTSVEKPSAPRSRIARSAAATSRADKHDRTAERRRSTCCSLPGSELTRAKRFIGRTALNCPGKGKIWAPSKVCLTPAFTHESSSMAFSPTPSIRRLAKLVMYFPPVATSAEILEAEVVSAIDGFMGAVIGLFAGGWVCGGRAGLIGGAGGCEKAATCEARRCRASFPCIQLMAFCFFTGWWGWMRGKKSLRARGQNWPGRGYCGLRVLKSLGLLLGEFCGGRIDRKLTSGRPTRGRLKILSYNVCGGVNHSAAS